MSMKDVLLLGMEMAVGDKGSKGKGKSATWPNAKAKNVADAQKPA